MTRLASHSSTVWTTGHQGKHTVLLYCFIEFVCTNAISVHKKDNQVFYSKTLLNL